MKKSCLNKECNKWFYGTKRAKFCCDKCRVTNWRKGNKMTVATKEMFLEQVCERSDKWEVYMIDGTSQTFKHLYNGSDELAEIVDWSGVKIVDNEIQAFAL